MRSMSRRLRLASILLISAVVLGVSVSAKADVAPPPGYSAIANSLVLRPEGDVSGFRYFLVDMSGGTEEVMIGSSPVVIDAAGRGGPGRYAALWAVPAEAAPRGLSPGRLNDLGRSLLDGHTSGAVKLIDHNFRKEVFVTSSIGEHRESYVLFVDTSAGRPSVRPVGEPGTGGVAVFAIIAAFVAAAVSLLAIAVLGFWLLNRSRRRRREAADK
jgi:hypothetical protein